MLKKRPQVMVGNDYTEQLESCEQFVALMKKKSIQFEVVVGNIETSSFITTSPCLTLPHPVNVKLIKLSLLVFMSDFCDTLKENTRQILDVGPKFCFESSHSHSHSQTLKILRN